MSIPWNKWEKNKTVVKEFLTLQDFLEAKEGTVFDVLILDRNVFDDTCNDREENKIYSALDFFSKNRHQIVKTGNFSWVINWKWDIKGESKNKDIHLFNKQLGVWYPLTDDGFFHIKEEIELFDLTEEEKNEWENKKMHYTEFPLKTYIGWRGPIILWEKLEKLPDVLFLEDPEWD